MTVTNDDTTAAVDVDRTVVSDAAAHVVEFALGEETCAIDIDSVDSIVETKQITRVPRAPDAVEGVMDLRGETTAVVDPKQFLSVGEAAKEKNILVLDRDDDKQKIGIRVDEVTEVGSYSSSQVDENGQLEGIESSALSADLIKGVVRKHVGPVDEDDIPEDVELVLWLDIDTLIASISNSQEGDADRDNQV